MDSSRHFLYFRWGWRLISFGGQGKTSSGEKVDIVPGRPEGTPLQNRSGGLVGIATSVFSMLTDTHMVGPPYH